MTLSTEQARAYATQFQANLIDNITYVLALIQHAGPVLPGELQRQALHTLRYALQLPSAWVVTRDLVTMLAPKMEQAGRREDWLPYLQQALHQSLAQHDDMTAGECHLQLAILYRLLSQFATAHTHLQAALESFTVLPARRDQARVLNELAWLEHLQHHYAAASQHVADALALLDEDDPERGMSYRVQGMIAIDEERWQDAERLHVQALTIFEQEGNRRKIAWGLQNLAYALRGQHKFVEGISYYKRAASILQEIADIHHLAVVLFNLGGAYYYCQELENAVTYLTQAHTIFRQLNNKLFIAKLDTALGLVYQRQGHYVKAEAAFLFSIQHFQEVADEAWRLNAVDGLAIAYLSQQKFASARATLEKALTDLSNITEMPNYQYLYQSFHEHLAEAKRGEMSASLVS